MRHLSRKLSKVLRHSALDLGLHMDEAGYVSLDALLAHPMFQTITRATVIAVVNTNNKQRYGLSMDRLSIRAHQGHSIKGIVVSEALLTPLLSVDAFSASSSHLTTPSCLHGTYFQCLDRILLEGLSRRQRNHIHFTTEKDCLASTNSMDRATPRGASNEDATTPTSALRSSVEVLIYINVALAMSEGLLFYRSDNHVILCPGNADGFLLPRYFTDVLARSDGRRLTCGADGM